MRESIIHHFTRGGQVFFHNWHMALQIISRCIVVMFLVAFVLFSGWCYSSYEPVYGQTFRTHMKAETLLFFQRPDKLMDVPISGYTYKLPAKSVKKLLWHKQNWDKTLYWLWVQAYYAGWCTIAAMLLFLVYFSRKGIAEMRPKFLRGDKRVELKKLVKQLTKQKMTSDCVIDGLPLVKGTEVQHIGIVGTTGVGKSILVKKLMHYAAKQSHQAIVYDKTGELTAQFYDPERGDIILNPFDARSPAWNLWADCQIPPDFDALATSLLPNMSGDPFWTTGARTIFAAAAREYGASVREPKLNAFLDMLFTESVSNNPLLMGTEAQQLITGKDNKTAASLMGILVAFTKSLRAVPIKGPSFSINEWVRSGKGFLFLTSQQKLHESVKPLYASWITLAIDALMSGAPNSERRFWLFLDELPSLQRIPSLPTVLAEGRKFGACVVAGLQSIAQLEDIYGTSGAKKISSLLNTRFYFRQSDHNMAKWASMNLGESQMLESHESISYGANTIRDGVNVNRKEKHRAIATTSDLQSLPDRHCFVRLPGAYPIVKHELIYVPWKNQQSAYEPRGIKPLDVTANNQDDSTPLHQISSANVESNLPANVRQDIERSSEHINKEKQASGKAALKNDSSYRDV